MMSEVKNEVLQHANALMNPDHYWKERAIEQEYVINPKFDLTNSEILAKFPFITTIVRDCVFGKIPEDTLEEYVLYIDDGYVQDERAMFNSNVKNFIRLVVKGSPEKLQRTFHFRSDVTVTEINACEQMNYSTCSYECDGKLDLFIFEKERNSTTKQNTIIVLNKPDTQAFVTMAIKTQPGQKRDDYIEFQHTCHHTYSEVNYLALNDGIAISQANSLLDKVSRQSESYQNLKHILLSETAKSYAKPNLMIQNPDVMAKHGTNIGALDDNNLSYLQMRGIDKETGQLIIQRSLMEGVIEKHPHSQHIKDIYYDF